MAIWDTVLKALKNAFLNEKDALGYTIPFFGFAILIGEIHMIIPLHSAYFSSNNFHVYYQSLASAVAVTAY